jgi:hypothetical protein
MIAIKVLQHVCRISADQYAVYSSVGIKQTAGRLTEPCLNCGHLCGLYFVAPGNDDLFIYLL